MSNVIHPADRSKFLLTLLSMCALTHFRRREMRKRHLPQDTPESKLYWVDHPCFGYLYENLFCFALAFALAKFTPAMDLSRPAFSFARTVAFFTVLVDPQLMMEKFMATTVFSHVPYFSPRAPAQDLQTLVREYLRCNVVVTTFSSLIFMIFAAIQGNNGGRRTFHNMFGNNPAAVRFWPYLAKFAFCRIVVDVTFGLAHMLMHESKSLYSFIHKHHHEHQTPRTQTNLHFTWLDQFLEAVFPVFVSIGALTALGYGPSRYEQPFLILPLVYYESASHTGKEIPIVTWFPLLSPLVDWITGCDQRLIEYHTRHHQLYRCNYSISPWFDKLIGTYRIDLPDSYSSVKAAEEDVQ